jgi:hypothetical protein
MQSLRRLSLLRVTTIAPIERLMDISRRRSIAATLCFV